VTFTPDQAGDNLLVVRSVDAHGDVSGDRFYFFEVAEGADRPANWAIME
jgi:hypothetical protein